MSDQATEQQAVWEARGEGLWNNRQNGIVFVAGSVVEAKRLEAYLNQAVNTSSALETELKTLRAKAELADLVIGYVPALEAAKKIIGQTWGRSFMLTEIIDKAFALTQPAGEGGQTNA